MAGVPKLRFHLIANAHLDPVWLWDWREGLNEGIATCRAVLDLMDAFPELTFVRGEASVYEHLEQHAPDLFARLRVQIERGRWDVVGGNFVQPDTNLPATEVLNRQFHRGLNYFKTAFGVRPTVAWAPDSFGHSAGWPEIYAAAGITALAFSRPFASDLALPGPAFWWEGPGHSRVLAWRMPIEWYGSTRTELPGRLDKYKAEAPRWGLENVPIFFGLGNHGGGPSRAQIEAILRWRDANADVQVEFSTLHRFFAALTGEAASLRTFRGELNFALRGCYASMASFKVRYRRTESALLRAERTAASVAVLTNTAMPDLREAWDAVLFNTFHDILPGTSIERAYVDQHAWLGVAWHHAQRAELAMLNRLSAAIDTSVPSAEGDRPTVTPVLLWNSHAEPFAGAVEFEVPLDYRPLDAFRGTPDTVPLEVRDDRGRLVPHQCVATEHDFAPEVPWRKRFVVRTAIPACGWQVLTAGWAPHARPQKIESDLRTGAGWIANRHWRVRASTSSDAVVLTGSGKARRLTLRTVDDSWGSWGGHDGEVGSEHIDRTKAVWIVKSVQVLERGPERAVLWVRFAQGASWAELSLRLYRDDPAVVTKARVFWAAKAARLKLSVSSGGVAEFEVPGGTVVRQPCGEVPGGRWVRVGEGPGAFVFASDALYNFDVTDAVFSATVVRSSRYAANNRETPTAQPWRSHTDLGEHVFEFALARADADGGALARRLESPPLALITGAHGGPLARSGGVLQLGAGVQLLAFHPAPDGWLLRVQNVGHRRFAAKARLLGVDVPLGVVDAGRIRTFELKRGTEGWSVTPVTTAGEPAIPSS